ncbi:MAG: hypothetical protein ACRCRP_01985 [Metamycoplasmataceae bacterium]
MYKTRIININGVPSQVIEYPQNQPNVVYNNSIPQTQVFSFDQNPMMNQQNMVNPYQQQNNGFQQNQPAPQMFYNENQMNNSYSNMQEEPSIFDEQFCSETKEKLNTVKFLFETREIDYEQYLKLTKKLVVDDLEKNK